VVTDIDPVRLARAEASITPAEAKANGVELHYVNTGKMADPVAELVKVNGGKLYDDVFCFAPVSPVVQQADALLGHDGCLNFFAGPTNTAFSAPFNFYNVHYEAHHLCGTSGGNTDDLRESLKMFAEKTLNPVALITHVGGLNVVPETTINLDKIPGGKKLIYTHKKLPLTAIADFAAKGKEGGELASLWAGLAKITDANNQLWCKEAEEYLLKNAPEID
jgi:threonine dehydrogenase-like Zn-dependent dehydrogenase